MALGNTVQYTPFQETSFGYGSGQLATNYATETEFPNATDIVKIVIEHDSGNWDDTGHISTPSSGTAISLYNKQTKTWTVKGQRSDVDVVLSQLKFFPADYEPSREWSPLAFKENVIDGQFLDEQPPAIGDTLFTVRIYDGNDVQQGSSETLTFDPVEPSYDNQRPYWSVQPTTTDYSSATFDSEDGDTLDFGTISHGTDTDNVTVSLYVRPYRFSDASLIHGSGTKEGELVTLTLSSYPYYGLFLTDDFYINDKKPNLVSGQTKLQFTGSVAECNTFLENVKYKTYSNTNEDTFEIVATVTDGVIGSVITKPMWHQKTLQVSTIPSQSFVEDITSNFSFGDISFSNLSSIEEVDTYRAVITLDATGVSGAVSFGTSISVETETYVNGVLTIEDSNLSVFRSALNNLEFDPVTDFNDDFTFTVDFTFSNATFGSSYNSVQQTVNVRGQERSEVANITRTHTWKEDQVYFFKNNNPLKIIHPVNQNFEVIFDYSPSNLGINTIGQLQTTNTVVTKSVDNNRVIKFTGTRDELNDALEKMYFAPQTDLDQSFTIDVTVNRTSGDLTFETPSTGVFTMSAIPQEEYSHTQPAKVTWEEDTDKVDFATGIKILDTSLDDPLLPAYGGKFKMSLRAKYNDGSDVSTDDMSWSCFNSTNCTVTGSGTVSNPLIITGDRADMNVAINALRMIPAADFTATQDFYFEYKLERGESTDDFYALYVDYSKSVKFDKGTPNPELETPATIKFGIERLTPIDYQIVDRAKNKQYTLTFTISNDGEGFLRATKARDATVSWNDNTKVLTITGNKQDINLTLLSLEYVPTFNFSTDFEIYYYQYQETDGVQQSASDGSAKIDMENDPTLLRYDLDTDNTNLKYFEDLLEQRDVLKYTRLKNLDGAEEITELPITYVTTLKLSPADQIYFSYDYAESGTFETGALLDVVETRGSEITFTGSRDYCNQKIREIVLSGYPDQIGDVDVLYTQERWVGGVYESTQADEVTALTIRGVNAAEARFTSYKQYFTTEGAQTVTGENVTPKYLQEFATDDNGNIKNRYSRPITILDKGQEPEGVSLYKFEVLSSDLLDGMYIQDMPYKTKEQFHSYISKGITLVTPENLIDEIEYNQEFKVNFAIKRKLASGTESTITEGILTYEYVSKPRSFKWISDNEIEYTDSIEISNDVSLQMENGYANQTSIIDNSNFVKWGWGYRYLTKRYFLYDREDVNYEVADLFDDERVRHENTKNQQGTAIWADNYTNTSGENLDLDFGFSSVKLIRNVVISTRFGKYNVEVQSVPTQGVLVQTVQNSWGLKNEVKISYKQDVIRYSEHMSHIQEDDGFNKQMFGFDTAGLRGSWAVKKQNYQQFDPSQPSQLMSGDAVLCSHFWVSGSKYAFGWYDTNADTKKVNYPFDAYDGSKTLRRVVLDNYAQFRAFPVDQRYISSPKLDNRIRTPLSPGSIEDSIFYKNAISFDNLSITGRIRDIKQMNYRGLKTQHEIPAGSTTNDGRVSTFVASDTYGDNGLSYSLGIQFGDLRDFDESDIQLTGITHNRRDSGVYEKWNSVGNQGILYLEDNPFWFVDLNSIIGVNDTNMTDRKNARMDISIPLYDNIKVIDQQERNVIKYIAAPERMVYVRSYWHAGKTYNEAVSLFMSRDWDDNNFRPDYRILRKYTNVKDGELEKNMWARRNHKDNTSRILTISVPVDGDGFDTAPAYILPTGEYIHPSYGLTTFDEHPLLNLKTDLRGKNIDKFIKIDSETLAYVSVEEGKIDDGLNNIDIRFNNELSANENYNYIYVTQNPYNEKQLYAMMAYLNSGETSTSDAGTLRSRLIYINL